MNITAGMSIPVEYEVKFQIYKNNRYDIFKAVHAVDNKEVALKITRPDNGDIYTISKLSHEYNVLKNLDHPNLVKVYSLFSGEKSICLVEEFFSGESLKNKLSASAFSINEFFIIVINLAEVLSYIHANGIIHKDLNTNNILISDTNQVKLIDFGVSVNNQTEVPDLKSLDMIEGVLAYISPEQTGRTSYRISNSSDLYSLGIIMYEMLTGSPPFNSDDQLEVIHFHLSRNPIPLNFVNPKIPLSLSNLINTLLEKNPDDRYQSASGLLYDLKLLHAQWAAGEETQHFIPRKHDLSGKFKKTQRLYGRDEEIERLLNYFNLVRERKSAFALVSGYSGIGKSVVVKQLHKPVLEKNGLFLTGKFDQFKRNIPYFAFIEIFNEAIRNILASSDEKISEWKEKIESVLGVNTSLVTEVIPNVELIVGKYPKTVKLKPAEQEYRFRTVFLDFILCFAGPESPLVLFLDDLQWADIPSLNLIESVLTISDKSYIFIIGAYRSNEVDELNPLSFMINKLKKEGVYIEEIALPALNEVTTIQITADSFGIPFEKAKELGRHVYLKTKGNPFFINRFLLSIYEHRCIYLDSSGEWNWDQSELEKRDYTDNVIDLMAKELSELPQSAQDLMKISSVMGNTFNLGTLSLIAKKTQNEVFDLLRPALKLGFIFPSNENYRTLSLYQEGIKDNFQDQSSKINNSFRFLHDRVQQAAYALIPVEKLSEVHIDTGRIIYNNTTTEKLGDSIFDIVIHFADYTDLIKEPNERKLLSNLFLIAGKKAKDSTSYVVAVKYLNCAFALVDEQSWKNDYNLTLSIYSELAESEYLNSNHEKAEFLLEQILKYAQTNLEKLRVYYIHSSLYHKIGNSAKAMEIGKKAMNLYGIKFPEKNLAIKIQAGFELTRNLLLFSTKYRNIDRLNNLKECKDPEIIAINQYLIDIATSAYQINQELMVIVVLRIIRFYLKFGFTDASGWGLSGFSVIVYSALGLSKRGLRLWDLTLRLHEKTNSQFIKTKLGYTVNAFHSQWNRPLKKTFDANISNIRDCIANGDPSFTSFGICDFLYNKSASGLPLLKVIDQSKEYLEYLQRTKNTSGILYTKPKVQVIRTLLEKTLIIGDWDDDEYNSKHFLEEIKSSGDLTVIARYYNSRLSLYYFFEQYSAGLDWAQEGNKFQSNLLGFHTVTEWCFYYNLLISSSYRSMNKIERKKYSRIFKENLKWFQHWVKGCAENYEQQYNILLAEELVMSGKPEPAIKFYELAIQKAHKNGFTQFEAIANYQASKLMAFSGIEKQSFYYFKDAYSLYFKWNAVGICTFLKSKYPKVFLSAFITPEDQFVIDENTKSSGSSSNKLDFNTVVKASQSLASEIHIDKLLESLMYIIIENAGAQRGVLVLFKKNELFIAAEGYSGPGKAKVFDSIPVKSSNMLPESLINYCWRTQEYISIPSALTDEKYQYDAYVKENSVLSMICFPISNKRNKIGLIYLENNLVEGIFNPNRIEVLNMLSGQIGISIDNAFLYENLEVKVKERTLELEEQKEIAELQKGEALQLKSTAEEERKKSDELLLNIFPIEIANELKTKGSSEARLYQEVTVIFTDFVNFSAISERLSPNQLVNELNYCFEVFDQIIEKNGLEKIKTIGDAYLAVCGLPIQNKRHAEITVNAALDILKWVKDPANKCIFDIRIGINSGPVVAGIVGFKKYVYDIWGDTVNTAARMETASEPGKINISESTYRLVENQFNFKYRGKIEAKNKGVIEMYFVNP